MQVEHTGHPIEAKAVEMKFLDPIAAVRQQKAPNLLLPIVETAGVPGRMQSAISPMKVQVLTPVQSAESLFHIFYRVGMHQIHNDSQAHLVRLIDQVFEVLRCAKTRSEERRVGKECRCLRWQ